MSSVSVGQTLSAVTTAGGLYPQLDQQIIQLTMPYMPFRGLCAQKSMVGSAGNTFVWARQTGQRTAVFSEVAESAYIPLDSTPYGYSGVTVYKIGEGFLVSRELIEDTYLPVVQDHMVRFGIRAANKVDNDVVKTLIAGATNTAAASGSSLGATGTTFAAYRTGAIGQQDIVINGILPITKINYFPDTAALNPIQEADLFMLPMFTEQWQYGEAIVRSGFLENEPNHPPYGVQPVISNNVPAGTAIVLASGSNPRTTLGQYAPGIFFVEKRPLTTATEDVPAADGQAVYFSARYAANVQVGGVISLITGLATS